MFNKQRPRRKGASVRGDGGGGGSGRKSSKCLKLDELILPNARLRFCTDQLHNLNYIFNKKLECVHGTTDKCLQLAKSVTERLVQRLVCGAGMIDTRFASKFLIRNDNQHQDGTSNHMTYMVRIDSLSMPCIYKSDEKPQHLVTEADPDYPPAYARLRLHGTTLKIWEDHCNSYGYLRRDKVQARFVELLAMAASKDVPSSPLNVDESLYCGIPGKIVDSYTLYNILKIPPDQHVFYGPGGNVPKFPDPRDFRLAIIDEPTGIRLRVEFLSPALSSIVIDVCILVAIAVDAWPATTDFPMRVSLGHSDCLLYHEAAQTGMFLVGYGVQSSAWHIRLPSAEHFILNHYSPNSTVITILDILNLILEDIDTSRKIRNQISYKILNHYILQTVLLEELEESSRNPIADLIYWSPLYLSTHVLTILDKLIPKLLAEKQCDYFFKKSNLLVNPGHLSDEDFTAEATNVKTVMMRLFDESLMSTDGNEEFDEMTLSLESEMILLHKWKDLIESLLPPSGTRGRRFCFAGSKNRQDVAHTQYTYSQMEYIGLLLKKMLKVRQHILYTQLTEFDDTITSKEYENDDHPLEDIIYLLVTILNQARDQYLFSQTNQNILKNKLKINSNFNVSTAKLVELMRKDKELSSLNLEDDSVLVKTISKWLYKAMDQNKRYLGPLLRPYMNNLFTTSHALSWHMDSIRQRMSSDEVTALGAFAQLVNDGKITPAQGLIDCVQKNWSWAKSMLRDVEKNTLRVVFISERGNIYRHILSLPSYQRKSSVPEGSTGSKTLDSPSRQDRDERQRTLPDRNYFNTILKGKSHGRNQGKLPQHEILKFSSPINLIMSERYRRGDHRGGGDVFVALASMQKLSIFQEVTTNLPQEQRSEILTLIHSIQSERPRRTSSSTTKRWSGTLPQTNNHSNIHRNKFNQSSDSIQKYTAKEESAGIKIADLQDGGDSDDKKLRRNSSSLLGTCRAARIREDSSMFYLHDSIKIKALLHKTGTLQ